MQRSDFQYCKLAVPAKFSVIKIILCTLLIFIPALSVQSTYAQTASTAVVADRKAALDRSVECTPPTYPPESLARNETGKVSASYLIDVDGSVKERKVEKSSGFDVLDSTALEAIGRCKFIPAVVEGKFSAAWVNVNFTWKLDEPADEQKLVKAIIDPSRNCPKPTYPRSSLENGEFGTTTIAILVGLDGTVDQSKIITSSGYDRLDQAALESLSKCKFIPANVDGKSAKVWSHLTYTWAIDVDGIRSPDIDIRHPCKDPVYPPESLRLKESGATTLKLAISSAGDVVESSIMKSSGFDRLDEAARLAFLACKFTPRKDYGRPTKGMVSLKYEWKLPPSKGQ